MSKNLNNAFPSSSPGGGGGATNLGRTLSATQVVVTSDTGTDATIPAADTTNAGVMTKSMFDKLNGIEASADVTDAGNVGSSIHGATAKTTPVDNDTLPLIDSAASNVLKKTTWANIKATLKSYFDSIYGTFTSPMSASGDIIYGGTAGAGTRLAKGTDGQVLTLASGLPSWATPSSGSISVPKVYYVETNGNDATGELGNPSKPFATATAAEAAGHAAAVYFVIKLGATPLGGPHTLENPNRALSGYLRAIIGCGDYASEIQIINTPPTGSPGSHGTNGFDNTLYLYDLSATIAANGGSVTPIDTETLNGGHAGNLTVNGRCLITMITAYGGPPMNTGTGGNGANITLSGDIKLLDFNILGGVNADCTSGTNGTLAADGADLRALPACTVSSLSLGRCSYDNAVIVTITNDYGGNAVY